MREILFRAKKKEDGEWEEGNIFIHNDGKTVDISTGNKDYAVNYRIDPETICQYTGLKDKNGNRIWENDVVRLGANMLVKWSEKYAGWCLAQRGWMYEHFFGEAVNEKDCEVVGNIFDNPELIEGRCTCRN